MLGDSHQRGELRFREAFRRAAQLQTGLPQNGAPQAAVEGAGEKVLKGQRRKGCLPRLEKREKGFTVPGAQEIQKQRLPRTHRPGELKDCDAADAEVGKLYFSAATCHGIAAVLEYQSGVRADAFEAANGFRLGAYLHQRRGEGRDVVPQGF